MRLIEKRNHNKSDLKIYKLICLLFAIVVGSNYVFSQTDSTYADSTTSKSLKDKLAKQVNTGNIGFIPVPVFGYSPETGFVFGMSIDYYFNTSKTPKDTTTRESFLYAGAAYSTRKQLFTELFWQIFGPGEKYILRGKTGFSDFSEYYWGVGNNVLSEKDKKTITYTLLQFKNRLLFNTRAKNFVGFGINYSLTKDILGPEKMPLENTIDGYNQSRVVGIGPAILYDYRNNPFSPTRGWYAEYYSHWHHKSLGSNFNYFEQQVDLRKYFKAFGKGMLGFQMIGSFNTGSVPLRELSKLGGAQMLRGYILGRYRDKNMWGAQFETRYPLGKYFGVAAFGAVGQVSDKLENFKLGPLYSAAGAGLRIKLNSKKQIYSRIDYAYSANKTGQLYLRLMDAF